jgi:hypothetical protein
MKRIVDKFSLEMTGVDPDELPLDSFTRAVAALRDLLSSIDTGNTLEWGVIRITMQSPMTLEAGATPRRRQWNAGVADTANGILAAVKDNRTPRGAKPKSVKYARKFTSVLNDGVAKLAIATPTKPRLVLVKPSPDESKSNAIAPESNIGDYEADVELTGILETATTAGGGTAFFVRDPLNNRKTECDVPRHLFNEALEAMKRETPLRVAVSGRTRYVDGRPHSMRVETFEVWPTLEEHPGLFAVQGIDVTGGMDAVEYLRSIRGDQTLLG